jgi:carboxylesterase type B
VYAPSTPPPPGGRAVLFFIYGGNFQFGTAGTIDGSAFAAYENVILITANYRTNGKCKLSFRFMSKQLITILTLRLVFGFPPPDFVDSHQNLGFLDQRLALDWIQKNVYAFGGDPGKVLVFGQSAGAMSIDAHLTSMPQNSPFRAAILESGQYSYLTPGLADTGALYWNSLLQSVNCSLNSTSTETKKNEINCLKKVPVNIIREVIERSGLIFYPSVDNHTMIAHPIHARATSNFAKVPIISGTVANEGTVGQFGENNLTAWMQHNFGVLPEVHDAVLEAYPRIDGESDFHLITRIFSDWYFLCVSTS